MSFRPRPIKTWTSRLVNARPEELRAMFLSFAYFFCLLCGYYILRPLREEMGIVAGVDQLQWLFTAACGCIGAIVGPALTATFARPIGPVNLLLVSAVFLIATLVCVRLLLHLGPTTVGHAHEEASLGGGILEGLTALARSRYLMG